MLPEGLLWIAPVQGFSCDIDIFQDSEERLVTATEADAAALVTAGLTLSWGKVQNGKTSGAN